MPLWVAAFQRSACLQRNGIEIPRVPPPSPASYSIGAFTVTTSAFPESFRGWLSSFLGWLWGVGGSRPKLFSKIGFTGLWEVHIIYFNKTNLVLFPKAVAPGQWPRGIWGTQESPLAAAPGPAQTHPFISAPSHSPHLQKPSTLPPGALLCSSVAFVVASDSLQTHHCQFW